MEEQLNAIRTWLGQGSINIFGMPFAGKDTQGGVLADLLNAHLLGGGEILRNSDIPPHVQAIMNDGGLIPTEDYQQIVLPYLKHEKFNKGPLVLSSVGRWDGEQHGVMQATAAAEHPLKAVLLLTVDEETARTRHAHAHIAADRGARVDDTPAIFDTRLAEYREKTVPVIEFYRNHGLLVEIDGTPEPPAVTQAILQALAQLALARA